MGNLPFFGGQGEQDDEEQEQEKLQMWRPASGEGQHVAVKRKRGGSSKSSESSETGSRAGQSADSESVASSVKDLDAGDDDDASEKSGGGDGDKKSDSGHDDDASSQGSDAEKDDALAKKGDGGKRKKKIVVRMEFEPLLELHEPLPIEVQDPAEIFSHKKKRKAGSDALAISGLAEIKRAKAAVHYMNDQGTSEIHIRELASGLGEDADELRYALEQSARFQVDEDGMVTKTLLQVVFDNMTNEIEAMDEVLVRLEGIDTEQIEEIADNSLGQLRVKTAKGISLLEIVDMEAEQQLKQDEEKEMRLKAKEDKKKAKSKKNRRGQNDDSSSSSSEDEDGIGGEAEKKALAFRRVQVQRKIEEFLKSYTKGQNLVKINAKGRRYHRRVYVDTTKRALVVQGASGPKFFPFASMREVDIETRTTKEGRVETLVICAIEKGGRITKELNLSFPDQAKATSFVNCVTLFSMALRNTPKS